MIVKSSVLFLQQQHQRIQSVQQQEQLRVRGRSPVANLKTDNPVAVAAKDHGEQPKTLQETLEDAKEALNMEILRRTMAALTGKALPESKHQPIQDPAQVSQGELSLTQPPGQARGQSEFALSYQFAELRYEYEALSFSAQGSVTLQDGRTFDISAAFSQQRSFVQYASFSVTMGEAEKIDPLVLNFTGSTAALTGQRFDFDLNADGETERLASLAGGNAYLALDRNQDGMINDGRELFGPETGNGFKELARYDQDGNGFIDEGDAIFKQLSLWFQGETDTQLVSLQQQGVGAIYLHALDTSFAMQQQQQTVADLVKSSIYLTEAGQTGFVQQLDFRV
ncbi:MAG: hypothetical protein RQ715_10305 [Methylococcales bacterium]|nr:hypothetical protein [Methylococcales bacterium]